MQTMTPEKVQAMRERLERVRLDIEFLKEKMEQVKIENEQKLEVKMEAKRALEEEAIQK